MEFFSQTYVALRGPAGAPQTAADTIARLSDRLSPATLLADRRAAVFALKGLARDCKQEVGERALNGLLEVLYNDAEVDSDLGKAVLETLNILCDVEDAKELGFKYTDAVLATDKTVHALFALLADQTFYTRLATLQYLSTLLQNRRQIVQSYFLTAPVGATSVISTLEEKREIIRNEAISMLQLLTSQSPDIQKILAFEGAFEKFFNIVSLEGGVEGGITSQEALTCVDMLLRFNSSNQSYFRETGLPPVLCTLLLFPPNIPLEVTAPQEFALQFWDAQKLANASLVVGIIGLLVGSKGSPAPETAVFTRFLIEVALASNAPTTLKTQALRLIPATFSFPLSSLTITPYMPVPETNGEEWDRLEPATALDALVELALHGEYNGMESSKQTKDGLELRAAAVGVFENFVRKEEVKTAILQAMVAPEGTNPADIPPTPLLVALASAPDTSAPLDPSVVTATTIASLLFSHLIRSSPRSKTLARSILPNPHGVSPPGGGGNFFVPADGGPPPAPPPAEDEDEDDEPQTLLQIINENLSLAFLSHSRANTSDRESREWDRLITGYLTLLSQWLWEDPGATREFLNAGGLGVLVESINQVSELDSIVPGLCAFLLGVCYEFNREPGEITRSTIYPILSRLGDDTLTGRISRLREDDRFKAVGPDTVVLPSAIQKGEGEIWFDWAFVDFWKSNYYTVQRGFSTEPDQLSSSSGGPSAESAMLIGELRGVIRKQGEEIDSLRRQLQEQATLAAQTAQMQKKKNEEDPTVEEVALLKAQLADVSSKLASAEEKTKEVEKEQEDLLVLLDEVSSKRKRDKERMRGAKMDVSEDEADDDEDDEE